MANITEKQISLLHRYSVGIVAENKLQSRNTIVVTPIESLTHLDGEIKSNPTKMEATAEDADGNTYQVDTIGDNAIEADWIPLHGSNRKSAPDVRRGERVQIYRFAETDQYYWSPLGADEHLRKLETVVFGISSNSKESEDSNDPKNMYFIEFSTHDPQHITLMTTKHEGERCRWVIQLNTKEGKFLVTDEEENHIEVNTEEKLVLISNTDKSFVEVRGRDINGKCEGTATVKAPKIVLDGDVTITGKIQVAGQATFQSSMHANGITSPAPVCGPTSCV